MNKIVIYIAGAIFLSGVVLKIIFALFFPDKFAQGARKVLFLDEREKNLFRLGKKGQAQRKKGDKAAP